MNLSVLIFPERCLYVCASVTAPVGAVWGARYMIKDYCYNGDLSPGSEDETSWFHNITWWYSMARTYKFLYRHPRHNKHKKQVHVVSIGAIVLIEYW